jgi:hypothetical protein
MDHINTLSKLSHHAYLYVGDPETSVFEIEENLRKENLIQNEDFLKIQTDNLSIEEVRDVSRFFSQKSSSEHRIVLIGTISIGYDAQNAFLKTLEDLSSGNHIVLVLPTKQDLLETISSRVFYLGESEVKEKDENISTFVKSNTEKKLALVDKMIKDVKDLSSSEKIQMVRSFIDSLEKYYSESKNKDEKIFLDNVYKARKYLGVKGVSPKYVLEMLAVLS